MRRRGSGQVAILLSALLAVEAGVVAPSTVMADEPLATPPPIEQPRPTAEPSPTFGPSPSIAPTEPPTSKPGALSDALAEDVGPERPELRTAHSQTFAKADGSLVTAFYAEPVFYQPRDSSAWQPIELTFEKLDGDGTEKARADELPTAVALRAADDPAGFLALTSDGQTISFGLPAGASAGKADVAPTVAKDGAYADYVDFLPGGIDLRVFPTAGGATTFLVLHQRPKTTTFALAFDAPGFTLAADKSGGLAIIDAVGDVAGTIAAPYMVDSTPDAYLGSGHVSDAVTLSVGGTKNAPEIVIDVDPGFLDDAVYPVYVDPTITFPTATTTAGDTFVSSRWPTHNENTYQRPDSPYYHEMWLGKQPDTNYVNEIFIRFNGIADALPNARVTSALLKFYPYHQYYASQPRPSWIDEVNVDWSASTITWNNRPTGTGDYTFITKFDTTKAHWASVDVAAHVQAVINAERADYGFRIHENGTGQGNWKRVVSRNDSSSYKPVLVVDWVPGTLDVAYPAGGATASRTLSWTHAGLGAINTYQVQVATSSSFTTLMADSGALSGDASAWMIPASVALVDGTPYWWRVRAKFGVSSTWSDWTPATTSFTWRPGSNLGLPGHNTFETFSLSGPDSLSVNVATGNLVVSQPIVALPYRGGTLAVNLSYNSQSSVDAGLGVGWQLSVLRRLSELPGGNVLYRAADGSEHVFTKIGTTGTVTTYNRPATIYATLVKDTAAAYRWTLTFRDLSVERFNLYGSSTGLLARSADRFGNGIDYIYTAATDRLDRATDPAGRYVEFTWDTSSSPAHLSSFTDWAYVSSNVVSIGATGARRLYRFFYSGANLSGWSNPRTTTGVCPSAAHLTCLSYNAGGLLATIQKRQTYTTLTSGVLGTANRDVITTIAYRGNEVASVQAPEQSAAQATTFSRTGAGLMHVERAGDPASATTYAYVAPTDDLGRVAAIMRALGGDVVETRTTWDANFPTEPAAVTDNYGARFGAPARTVSYTYVAGSLGLVSLVTEPLVGTDTRQTAYTYNANNDVTQLIVRRNTSSTERVITRYCYAATGCSTSGTALTMRATWVNWIDGVAGGATGNSEDVVTDYLYDAYGQRTSEARRNYDAQGNLRDARATGFTYDAYGNVTGVIANYIDGAVTSGADLAAPSGGAYTDLTTTYTYDTAGNRRSSADPRRAIAAVLCPTALRADDFVSRSTYGPTNLRVTESTPTTLVIDGCAAQPDASRSASYTYDPLGDLRSATDFGGLVSATRFTKASLAFETYEQPAGGTAVKTSISTYDAAGRLVSYKDRRQVTAGGQTTYAYDELGRGVLVAEAAGTYTETAYDGLGRTVVTGYGASSELVPLGDTAASLLTTYAYDPGGRVTEQNDGFSCTVTSYDYRDRAITVAEGKTPGSPCTGTALRTTTNSYDALDRLAYTETRDALNALISSRSDSFDAAGNLRASVVVRGTTTTVSHSYNVLDQATLDTGADGATSATGYDPAGNAAVVTTGAGTTTSVFDALNNRIRLTDSATGSTTTYDPDHNYLISAFYLPTGSGREHQTLYSYDARHRLIGIVQQQCDAVGSDHACASPVLTGRDVYEYDDADNRTRVNEWRTATNSTDFYYCYDAQYQLTGRKTGSACGTGNDEAYVYDEAGNRLSAKENGGTTVSFAYNASGQLCKTGATSCGTPNVTYDAAGRTASWAGWWFSYDEAGRLSKACSNATCSTASNRVQFTYDGDGHRSSVTTTPASGTATTVTYRYSGDSVVEEKVGSTVTRSYVLDEAGAIVKLVIPAGQSNAGSYLPTWNGHGDALALYRIDAAGTLTLANSYSYSTWGAPTTYTHNGLPDLSFRYLYVGRYGVQWDNAFGLGLEYMSARHYAPALGRFIQPDPSGLEPNGYGYAGANPSSRIDPAGLYYWYNRMNRLEVAKCQRDRMACLFWYEASALAIFVGRFHYSDDEQDLGRGDALRHCVWQCLLTVYLGAGQAREWGNIHERLLSGQRRARVSISSLMDLHNNAVGRAIGTEIRSDWLAWVPGRVEAMAEVRCLNALAAGRLRIIRGGRVVRSTT